MGPLEKTNELTNCLISFMKIITSLVGGASSDES